MCTVRELVTSVSHTAMPVSHRSQNLPAVESCLKRHKHARIRCHELPDSLAELLGYRIIDFQWGLSHEAHHASDCKIHSLWC